MSRNNASGYKGVHWCKQKRQWHAEVWHNYDKHHAGYFDDVKEAARAYNRKARELGFLFVPDDPS